jgi:hypothetical protein
MSEPLLETLSRFTPDAGTLDRDALIFAAARASVRPSRGLKIVACLLAGTQALSLVFLWPKSNHPGGDVSVNVAAAPVTSPALEPRPGAPPANNSGVWSARQRLERRDLEDRPAETLTLIDSEPPLRAFGPAPASLLVN